MCINLCSSLKELSIGSIVKSDDIFEIDDYTSIYENILDRSSKNLEKLSVTCIDDSRIALSIYSYLISDLLKLKYLDLSSCKWITDDVIKSFSDLPKLEVLKICGIEEFSGLVLVNNNFPNLKELHCQNCYALKDEHLINFLKCADKLELLDVIGCRKITNSSIKTAIEVTKNRTNNLLLEIRIKNTLININEIEEISPLLYLNTFRFK